MALQMNLLPKVKMDYIETSRNKKLVSFIAFLVTAGAVGILVILFFAVNVIQSKYSRDLSKDIVSESEKLKSIKDLDKVLTVQNQLVSLKGLHEAKPVTSRLFKFIQTVTPDNVSITGINVDFTTNTIAITGTADSIKSINTFVDTLKFTDYVTSDSQKDKAFTSVVLTSFSKGDEETSYAINTNFAPIIFASASDVNLEVPPGKITTRSETEKPTDLFKLAPENEGGQ